MRVRGLTLGTLLMAIAILGPAIAYAGVTVIYPKATHSVNVDTTPPLTFAQGSDYAQANSVGFASAFTLIDNSAAFTMTLSSLSGGAITIDKYVHLVAASTVSTFKAQIATAASGTLDATEIEVLKVRLWTGGTPPTADGSSGVCAVLDLEAALDTESGTTCAGNQTVYVQVVFQLATGSAGSSSVSIRPSSIVFA
jgi:hypothetical protein